MWYIKLSYLLMVLFLWPNSQWIYKLQFHVGLDNFTSGSLDCRRQERMGSKTVLLIFSYFHYLSILRTLPPLRLANSIATSNFHKQGSLVQFSGWLDIRSHVEAEILVLVRREISLMARAIKARQETLSHHDQIRGETEKLNKWMSWENPRTEWIKS